MVSFNVTKKEADLINKIADRADTLYRRHEIYYISKLNTSMNITATHANGNPLRLKDLLEADDFNFGHDVVGIQNHLDKKTGKLMHHFVPRFSKPTNKRERNNYELSMAVKRQRANA